MAGLTGIFDDIYIKQLFHKNERGETVFYPFGLMGRGYLLPRERETDVRRAMRLQILGTLIASISFGLVLTRIWNSGHPASPTGWLVLGVLFAVIFGGSTAFQFWIAKGLEPVSERVTVGEWLRRGRKARPYWTYWAMIVLGIISLLMAAGGIAISISDLDGALLAAGLFFLAIALFGIWDGARGIAERRAEKGE